MKLLGFALATVWLWAIGKPLVLFVKWFAELLVVVTVVSLAGIVIYAARWFLRGAAEDLLFLWSSMAMFVAAIVLIVVGVVLAKRFLRGLFGATIAVVAFAILPARADVVWAVRPEPTLMCMTVHGTDEQRRILQHPTTGTQAVAVAEAGPVVFVVKPLHVVRGFVEVERPERSNGWILQSDLSPYPGTCVPTLMSNGLIQEGQ